MTERLCLVHYHEIGLKGKTAPRSRTSSSPTCTRAPPGVPPSRASPASRAHRRGDDRPPRQRGARRRHPARAGRGARQPRLQVRARRGRVLRRGRPRARRGGRVSPTFKVHARRSSTTYERPQPRDEPDRRRGPVRGLPRQEGRRPHPDVTVVVHVSRATPSSTRPSAPGVGGLSRRHGRQGRDAALERLRLAGLHLDGGPSRRDLRARALLGTTDDRRHERVALPGHRRGARPVGRGGPPLCGALRRAPARDLACRAPGPAHHHVPPRHACRSPSASPSSRERRPSSRASRSGRWHRRRSRTSPR